ncbi:MAG: GDP-mannose 4,6-dehydratase [Candidatus Schekmanbacteria bacterium RIFCSPHIGHO2_02_FULL_38_11]|uniref:GDP-mannose 4,6-dehydratase n=1 Tax=Candidatus Schekmanbacteria bacterium RIFCSPLOWO2_12_FULL_38_15 TaxID=1817883 RepID=A0A1F7SJI8_9BACT|nr:MAG: GDP-mannose 4,6-dehydratase [Candidatus Schekmanbacteria bacterium GWA2_38_9]OGL50466.1 MAG: GDP-mannose 4,6-dehydratase [Candidatus Schekmanbacteria bacterium RIFCSPLOWO2_02_FULL_38_14]OGL53925.1 MAG: GDP-mannose 4,6-dehydratase [Candidatus Schekmanbacteria bacterium RIFCSPLOWO2_12_FULL_38_15]OGL54106.1 MAG: GDP-mannose 4,6-dehydratase [Candidatus Schekmanbacteria bacterium RIFCSPHIGHO2_02_FULL_38_11]
MKILITGITGFVGSHLAEYILNLNENHEVYGLCRWRSPKDNLEKIYNKVTPLEADLCDLGALIRHLKVVQPEVIFHLAAQSYVLTSFNSPVHTLWVNVIGTTNLLEAVRITEINPVVHICSSSEVYGQVNEADVPIKETCPFKPASPYAVSKVGEDMIAFQYFVSYGIKNIRTRMFTHTGPRRGDVFAMSSFAKQVAAAELGLSKPVVYVGNLKSVRTFCDVRDAVRAYWILINRCKPGEVYNIGGDRTMMIGEALDILLSLSKVRIEVKVNSKLLRPSDVTLQIPCIDKFKNETGWKPEIPFEKTLQDMLVYWKEELSRCPWKALTIEK